MKVMLKIARFELENLLGKKVTWIITVLYTLFVFVVCFSENLRQSYLPTMESVPVMLSNFVLPFALVSILIGVISPVFAGDKEQRMEQIPAACLIGSKGRSIAKLIGAIMFSLTITLLLEAITFVLCGCFGLCDMEILIRDVGGDVKLNPVWTAWQHFGFSAMTLIVGCIIQTITILFVSCSVQDMLSVISISSIIVLIEFILNKFSFPAVMQEYNIWLFFRPYYLFVTELITFSPFVNLLLYALCFLPFCAIAAWQIIKKGV